ncbi:hypothetical protein Mth01_02490 [Sphaerimonospora thailandensis]|uniref:Polyketide cyclase/dehydrase/lipid transport protein n=2 Tax=Sphaerimonospora thailandensis TaxID=795644 RepID=A0A8J3VXK4_9ACTN|nr:hypothetical protein Mth01_02490 [Sphaerimonospora thailandensis]
MNQSTGGRKPLFQARAEIRISARPKEVYAVISDLRRSGEWSPECRGGEWISGEPGTAGAVFRGHNERGSDVVAWAPVVRGHWITTCEVVEAEPDRTFCWAMCSRSGERQESVWGFGVEQVGDESVLVHHFLMTEPTEGIREITAQMDVAEKTNFFFEWGEKVQRDMEVTVARIKRVIEED